MHTLDGKLTFQPYGKEGEAILSISRQLLNQKMIEMAATYPNVEYFFNCRCSGFDLKTSKIQIAQNDGTQKTVEAACIIGADGSHSIVRQQLQKLDRYNYSQQYITSGYKELTIPPNKSNDYNLPPGYLHIWPRGSFMMIALPNKDKSFTCTLFMPFEKFEALKTGEDVMKFYKTYFSDAIPLMPNLVADFFENPTGSLVTVQCEPYHHSNNVVLIGDAAHAVIPFYGQGMNAAFEDCNVFDQLCTQYSGDMTKILPAFTSSRKLDCDAIAQLSAENYEEMRAKVASYAFLYRKKFEALIHRLFPYYFIPQYSMVAFTNMRYSEVITRRNKQKKWLDRLINSSATVVTVVLATTLFLKRESIRKIVTALLFYKK